MPSPRACRIAYRPRCARRGGGGRRRRANGARCLAFVARAPAARFTTERERRAENRVARRSGRRIERRTRGSPGLGPVEMAGCPRTRRAPHLEVQVPRCRTPHQRQVSPALPDQGRNACVDVRVGGSLLDSVGPVVRPRAGDQHLRSRNGSRRGTPPIRHRGHGADVHSRVWRPDSPEAGPGHAS
jgi:hypothetical protein